MEDFLKIYENGTHGLNDWKYFGNTMMDAFYEYASDSNHDYFKNVAFVFFDVGDVIYQPLFEESGVMYEYAIYHEGWSYRDMYDYIYGYFRNLHDTGIYKDYTCYKFGFYTGNSQDGDLYWEQPAQTMRNTPPSGEEYWSNYVTIKMSYDGSRPPQLLVQRGRPAAWSWDIIERNDYFRFDELEDLTEYVEGDQDPQIDPPDQPEDYPDSPLPTSDEYDRIIDSFLSNFTVLAEIDKSNLNIMAQALNNNLELDDSIPEMLGKIVRSLCQKNIADGIMSLKIIPIPQGGSLPYRSGIPEVLFKPFGLSNVVGKRLNNTLKKYLIGNMRVHSIFGDYRDFMCEYSIYLPFSGIHPLDADIIVGNNISIYVDIDFLTGSMLYHIVVNDGNTTRDIYTFTGQCAIELPITGADYSAKYQTIMNGVFSGIGMMAGGAMGGPVGAGAGMMIAGAAGTGLKTLGNAAVTKGSFIQSGKLIPNSSALSVLYPYLIISKPQDVSPNYSSVKGKPTHKMMTLSSLHGFSIVSNINLNQIPIATDEDKEALRSLLANGVYF